MHEIVINAQHEFELFKQRQITLSKEAIIKHAQQIAIYEYLLSWIERTDWYEMLADPYVYDSVRETDSLLQDLYYLILTEKIEPFNHKIYWGALEEHYSLTK